MLLLKNKRLSAAYFGLVIVYVLQTVLAPVNERVQDKYHITPGQLKFAALTIALPYVVIWIIALIGYLRLKTYVSLIDKHKDGAAFKTISQGVLVLCLWLPITAIINSATTLYHTDHPQATANLVRFDNYLNLLILLTAFLIIGKGATALLTVLKKPVSPLSQRMVLMYIGFSVVYVTLALSDPARQFPTEAVPVASYYLPDWLFATTILIPRLIYWFIAFQAARNILLYRKYVKGLIYKQAIGTLAYGLGGVVIATIMLRLFQTISTIIQDLSLAVLLIVVYILLIIIGAGYVLIAKGAKKLQKLEEF